MEFWDLFEIKLLRCLYPDLSGFEGWMDKKIDFQWIRIQMFS